MECEGKWSKSQLCHTSCILEKKSFNYAEEIIFVFKKKEKEEKAYFFCVCSKSRSLIKNQKISDVEKHEPDLKFKIC